MAMANACSSGSPGSAPARSDGGGSAATVDAATDATVVATPGDDAAGPAPSGDDAASGPTDGAPERDAPDGPAGSGTRATGQWVLGYYVGYQINAYPIASIDWTALTHIAFAPLTVDGAGALDTTFDDSNGAGVADAKALASAAHAHGVKALLMLGGANDGANIAKVAAPAKRAAFVSTLISTLASLGGYDGIDLDWEDSVNLDDLVSLAAALRAAQPGIVLSYPAGAINGNYQTVDARMATLAQSLDRFDVQTYYPSTAVAGQGWDSWFNSPVSGAAGSTPIAIDDTLQRYAAAGVPKAKLGIGMSFYAICYTSGITGPRQATSGSVSITGGDNAYPLSAFFAAGRTFSGSAAAEQKRDAVAEVPFLSLASAVNDPGCGGATRYISYDDETSIVAKGAFSKASGYGGIIVWTIGEGWLPSGAAGGRAPNALMQALKKGFLDP
jgi:chitinase